MTSTRIDVIRDAVESHRRLNAYAAARAAGYSVPRARAIARIGRPVVDDPRGTVVASGRVWAIENDLVDVSDLPGSGPRVD